MGRIVYPNRSRPVPIWESLLGRKDQEEESPCIYCRKKWECLDYMQYGATITHCNDPGR